MATVALDVFFPYIKPKVPGCPDPMVKSAIVTAATDFCTRSQIWHERLAAASVTSGSFPYTVPVSAHAELIRMLTAYAGSTKINPTTYASLDTVYDWETHTGTPTKYLFDASGRMVVYPLPDTAVDLRLRIANTVARDATVLEDFLYERWRDEIVHGALAQLTSDPARSWSNAEQYVLHANKFEQGVSKARIEAQRNLSTNDITVAPRPLA